MCAPPPHQLWHVVHDDGDEEDLEEHELSKARTYFDQDVEEMPPDDDEEKEDDDVVSQRDMRRNTKVHRITMYC